MSRQNRWLPILALAVCANIRPILTLPVEDSQRDTHTKLLGSSVVTSVSVVTPDSRKVVPVHEPPASPADLLRPDRFQFYTFNHNGEVVTKQMTEEEIHSLIAAGGGHSPMEIYEPIKSNIATMGETNVADIVQNVQKVLKGELSKPTTTMVSVPTIPGHATDEWSNILPSILSGDVENDHPSKPETNSVAISDDMKDDDEKNKNTMPQGEVHDTYQPHPAIIVEMEPHVHESPPQILVATEYIDKHKRPVKPQFASMSNPGTEEMSESLSNAVPVKQWTTITTMTNSQNVMNESAPEEHHKNATGFADHEQAKNTTSQKWKPITNVPLYSAEFPTNMKKQPQQKPVMVINTTKSPSAVNLNSNESEQLLEFYSEKPMIPVSVITADQILTSTQKTKINEPPVFQMLSTISPSAVMSTTAKFPIQNEEEQKINAEQTAGSSDTKLDTISIISETHSTSVKVPGHPEVKIPMQTFVPEKIKPIMDNNSWYSFFSHTKPHSAYTKAPEASTEKAIASTMQFSTSTSFDGVSSSTDKIEDSYNKVSEQLLEDINNFTISSSEVESYNRTNEMSEETKVSQDSEMPTTVMSDLELNASSPFKSSTETVTDSTIMYELLPEVTTESDAAGSEQPMPYTEIPEIEKIIQTLNHPEKPNIIYQTEKTTMNIMDIVPEEQTNVMGESEDSTIFSTMKIEEITMPTVKSYTRVPTTTMPTTFDNKHNAQMNTEALPTDLADSLSSVISQVAERVPTIISDSQTFPLSELKSKNISVNNDEEIETTLLSTTTVLSTVFTEEATTFIDRSNENKETTVTDITLENKTVDEQNVFTTEATSVDMKDGNKNIMDQKTEVTSSFESMSSTMLPDHQEFTKIADSYNHTSAETTSTPSEVRETVTSSVSITSVKATTKSSEKPTEAPIIRVDVTGTPADVPEYTADQGKNVSESPLIRIQLTDTVSAANHFIGNSVGQTGTPVPTVSLTLPTKPYSVSEMIGSGLIAGFMSTTPENMYVNNTETEHKTNETEVSADDEMNVVKENDLQSGMPQDTANINNNAQESQATEAVMFEITTQPLKDSSYNLMSQTLYSTEVPESLMQEENVTEIVPEDDSRRITMMMTESTTETMEVESATKLSDTDLDYINEFTTPHPTMTMEITTISNSLKSNKTKKPESPVVRIDMSPETTPSSLPPRIQLTDLPIIEVSSTNTVSSVTNVMSTSESPSLYKNNTSNNKNNIDRDNISNDNAYNITEAKITDEEKDVSAVQVPCSSSMANESKCQSNPVEKIIHQEQIKNMSKTEEATETLSYSAVNDQNNTVLINGTMEESGSAQKQTINKSPPPVKITSTDNGVEKVLENVKIDVSSSTSTSVPMLDVNTMESGSTIRNKPDSTNMDDNVSNGKLKPTTEIPVQPALNKDDSYIKLGEQHNRTEEITRPKNPNMKRKPTNVLTTPKPHVNKIQTSTTVETLVEHSNTTKFPELSPVFTRLTTTESTKKHQSEHANIHSALKTQPSNKDKVRPSMSKPSNLSQLPTSASHDKKPETTPGNIKNSEENRWTLIPTQMASVFPDKVKQEPKESSTSTIFPILNDMKNDEVHRTGNKPVPLDALQSAGLDDSIRHLDEDIVQFSNLCNEIAFNFWTSANKGLSSSRSLALSPFGMTSMLAMIFLGARGPTSAQMNDLLKLDDVATFNPHLVFQNITDTVSLARNQGIANAAFVRLLFADRIKVGKLMPFYKEQAQKFYEGFVAEVNFSTISDQVRRRTNLLIRKQTGGRIKDFVKTNTIPLRSPLAALSANVFQTNCNCSAASSEGRDGELYFAVSPAVRQRRLVPVPATVWRSGVLAGYEPGLDATAIALGGSEKLVSTIFVIPGQQGHTAPGDTLDRLEQRLMRTAYRDKTWEKLLKVIVPRPSLELQLPKFSHRSVINATAALKRMGLEDLFSGHANLKGINGFGHDIHLADVLQMNLFSTCGDENISSGRHHVEIYPGTPFRAARETESESDNDSTEPANSDEEDSARQDESLDRHINEDLKHPRLVRNWLRESDSTEKPRLKLDRPFLYFVRHNPTGLILHMGRFNPRLLP